MVQREASPHAKAMGCLLPHAIAMESCLPDAKAMECCLPDVIGACAATMSWCSGAHRLLTTSAASTGKTLQREIRRQRRGSTRETRILMYLHWRCSTRPPPVLPRGSAVPMRTMPCASWRDAGNRNPSPPPACHGSTPSPHPAHSQIYSVPHYVIKVTANLKLRDVTGVYSGVLLPHRQTDCRRSAADLRIAGPSPPPVSILWPRPRPLTAHTSGTSCLRHIAARSAWPSMQNLNLPVTHE
jgi:hypothetical protein